MDRLQKFIYDRNKNRDWANYISRDGASLVRQRIVEECGFSRSMLYQSEIVKTRLSSLEAELQTRGILKVQGNSSRVQFGDEISADAKMHELNSRIAAIQLRLDALSVLINDARHAGLRSRRD